MSHTSPHGVPVVESGESQAVDGIQPGGGGLTDDQRLLLLEHTVVQMRRDTRRSLNEGNAKFSSIEEKLKAISEKLERKPISVLQVAGLLLTSLALGGGIVFAAGQASVAVKGVDGIVEQVIRLRIDNGRIFDRLDALRASQGAKP